MERTWIRYVRATLHIIGCCESHIRVTFKHATRLTVIMCLICSETRSHEFVKRFMFSYSCPEFRTCHTSNKHIDILRSSTTSAMQNPNLKSTPIGIRCSGNRKCSQRYEINNFCHGLFSAIRPSEMPPKIPLEIPLEISPETHLEILLEICPELHLEMHLDKSVNNENYS